MTLLDVQFQRGESEDARVQKLRAIVEEVIRLSRQTSTSSSGGGSIASDASFLLAGSNSALPNGRVVAAQGGIALDLTQMNVAIFSISSVPLAKIGPIPTSILLGRYASGDGEPQAVSVGAGLELTSTGELRTSADTTAGYPPQLGHSGI